MTRGQLDMIVYPLAYAGGRIPATNLTLMPALVKNHDHAQRINESPFMAKIEELLNDDGVVTVAKGWLAGGFASTQGCIKKPEDVKGLQIRAAGKSFEQMLQGAGGSIAAMPSSEIYPAMQTGVLDAANTSSSSFVSYRIYEQVKCYTPAAGNALWFMYQPVLMSKRSYDKLNDAQKTHSQPPQRLPKSTTLPKAANRTLIASTSSRKPVWKSPTFRTRTLQHGRRLP